MTQTHGTPDTARSLLQKENVFRCVPVCDTHLIYPTTASVSVCVEMCHFRSH